MQCLAEKSNVRRTRPIHQGEHHFWGLTERDTDIAAVDVVGDGRFVGDQGLLALQGGPVAVV